MCFENIKVNMTSKNLLKWLAVIFLSAIASFALVISFYFSKFDGALSSDQAVWGAFGDFVGGTLNPILSFMALIALLLTIILQNRELEQTREELKRTAYANEQQANYIVAQQQRDDLFRLINKLADRINNNYNGNHLTSKRSIHAALIGEPNVNKNPELMQLYSESQDTSTRTYKILRYIESDLQLLSGFLSEYDKVSVTKAGTTPLPEFYKSEFHEFVKVLGQYNMIKPELMQFWCNIQHA